MSRSYFGGMKIHSPQTWNHRSTVIRQLQPHLTGKYGDTWYANIEEKRCRSKRVETQLAGPGGEDLRLLRLLRCLEKDVWSRTPQRLGLPPLGWISLNGWETALTSQYHALSWLWHWLLTLTFFHRPLRGFRILLHMFEHFQCSLFRQRRWCVFVAKGRMPQSMAMLRGIVGNNRELS